MSSRRYLFWFVATFLGLAVVTATFNLIIDPYLVFGSPRTKGVNQVKTEINEYVFLTKAFEPFRRSTDVLIAGNSRVEMGLDPNHACFEKLGLEAYNLGIPGAGVGRQLNYVLNVVYSQPVRRILLGVDFVDFLEEEGSPRPLRDLNVTTGNLPRRFDGSNNPEYKWVSAQTRFKSLLSLNALISSVQTLLLQGPYRADRLPNGFNPARDFSRATSLEGPGALFEQKMASVRERFVTPMSIYYADGSLVREFDLFSRFLDIAAVEGVEVVVLAGPFHELFWDLLREKGLLEMHMDWLAEIEGRVRRAEGQATIWDFSMDSEFIHEPVPPAGVKTSALNWFWEPSHYRKSLGDKMLDSMLASECGSPVSFGRQISVQN
jgi:hypothetical protein